MTLPKSGVRELEEALVTIYRPSLSLVNVAVVLASGPPKTGRLAGLFRQAAAFGGQL